MQIQFQFNLDFSLLLFIVCFLTNKIEFKPSAIYKFDQCMKKKTS